MNVAIESLVIDGEEDGAMQADGAEAPFALFSPDLQETVGGPYARRAHADDALELMLQGWMVPYTRNPVTWTIKGKPSPWYNK